MSDTIKRYAVSFGLTFGSTFLTIVAGTLSAGNVQWTSAFWFAVLLSATRAAIKAAMEKLAPTVAFAGAYPKK